MATGLNWTQINDMRKADNQAAWEGLKARNFKPEMKFKVNNPQEFKNVVNAHWKHMGNADEFIHVKPQVAKDSKLFGWFAKVAEKHNMQWLNQSLINIPVVKQFAENKLGAKFGEEVIDGVATTTVKATSESTAKNVATKCLSKVPVVGVLIDFAFRLPGIADTYKNVGFKAGTEKTIEEAGGAVGSTTGFFAGAALSAGAAAAAGAAVGTAVCPLAGTVVGGLVGFAGGLLGGFIGDMIGSNVSKIVSKPVGWLMSLVGIKDKPQASNAVSANGISGSDPLADNFFNNPYIQNPDLLLPSAPPVGMAS